MRAGLVACASMASVSTTATGAEGASPDWRATASAMIVMALCALTAMTAASSGVTRPIASVCAAPFRCMPVVPSGVPAMHPLGSAGGIASVLRSARGGWATDYAAMEPCAACNFQIGSFSGGGVYTSKEKGKKEPSEYTLVHPGPRGLVFDNMAWHKSEDYRGDRWSILAYTTRGGLALAPSTADILTKLGFVV